MIAKKFKIHDISFDWSRYSKHVSKRVTLEPYQPPTDEQKREVAEVLNELGEVTLFGSKFYPRFLWTILLKRHIASITNFDVTTIAYT